MTPLRNRILCMEFSAVMIDGAFSYHHTNCSLYKHLSFVFYKVPDTASFVTFVKSNAKALSTAVPSIKSCCCALRGNLPAYMPARTAKSCPFSFLHEFCKYQNSRANFIFTCISVYHTFQNAQKSLFYKEIYTYTLITELCSSRIFKVCPYVFSQKSLEILWHFFHHRPKYLLNT